MTDLSRFLLIWRTVKPSTMIMNPQRIALRIIRFILSLNYSKNVWWLWKPHEIVISKYPKKEL